MYVLDKVTEAILQYQTVDPKAITMDADIRSDLGADAIAVEEIMMSLEDTFDMQVPDRKIGLQVGVIVDYIRANAPQERLPEEIPQETKISA